MMDLSETPCSPETAAAPAGAAPSSFSDTTFNAAVTLLLKYEGRFSDDPDDPGGVTAYGISLREAVRLGDLDPDMHDLLDLNHDGVIDRKDMLLMTDEVFREVVRKAYWLQYGYNVLPPALAIKTLNLAFNTGPRQAGLFIQRAVRAAGDGRLTEDGILGPATRKAAGKIYMPTLLAAVRSEAAGFYRLLAAKNPKSRKWLGGWLNRAYS